jgi:hypothetical protein
VALLLLFVGGACEEQATTPPPPTPAQVAASAAKARKDCRDQCEQTALIVGGTETQLRACRARCDGAHPAPPHEVPSKITVAPPAHTPPAVKPR